MSSSKLTLIGFYSYMKRNDDNLFSQLVLPSGIDKQTVIDNILLEGGEFESYYSDPYFLQEAIGVWSTKWNRTFNKWYTALNISYDPLNNYDRTETLTESHSGKNAQNASNNTVNNSHTSSNSEGKNVAETTTSSSGNDSDTKEESGNNSTNNTISAFNATNLQPDTASAEVTSNHATDTHSTSAHTAGSDSSSTELASSETGYNSSNSYDSMSATDSWTNTHSMRAYGNIGVTTSQQMLQSELDLAEWNLYTHITDLFLKEFVIPLY